MKYDVVIVGGGLAGLTAAICLSKEGLSVLVLEKKAYPHHKVCGEYVSNEVRPFLSHLGLDLDSLGVIPIEKFLISNQKGKTLRTQLALGGFGVSRYALDHALYQLALENEVKFRFETAIDITFHNQSFQVKTKRDSYQSTIVLGAFGKRSALDKNLGRPFIEGKSPWLGIKGHFKIEGFPKNQVELHCFDGGYGGLSMTESGAVNFCYLTHYKSFQKEKDIAAFNKNVVSRNPFLKRFLEKATPMFKTPMGIAQISFQKKETVNNHIVMCGDTAGLIHPLCGNGMAMAIHAAKIASDSIIRFFSDAEFSREQMEREYQKLWKYHFSSRLYYGRRIQHLITNSTFMNHTFSIFPKSEIFLSSIIKQTHGKPILV